MKPANDPMREIERNESWLRSVLNDHEPPEVQQIKLVVRIAAQEQEFAGRLDVESPPDLAARVNSAVCAAVAEIRTGDQRSSIAVGHRRHRFAWLSGLAAAAAIGLAWFLYPSRSDLIPELAALSAYEAFEEDGLDRAIELLEEDVLDMELSVGELAAGGREDRMFDYLLDRIENLHWEEVFDDDWS